MTPGLSYNEIRQSCRLTAYYQKFAANGTIYYEQYEDDSNIYDCLFPDADLERTMPLTIYKTKKNSIK